MDQELHVKSTSQMLQEGLDEIFSGEYFRRFLSFVANNPNYSYRNAILILQQCPHAKSVMGLRAWNKAGRMVREGERGLRINARFNNEEQDEKKRLAAPEARPNKKKRKDKGKFRRISVFDISQTVVPGTEETGPEQRPLPVPAVNLFEPDLLEGDVAGYDNLLAALQEVSPLPIVFRSGVKNDGSCGYTDITVRKDLSQLHTVRTVMNQIVHAWRRAHCPDREQLAIEAESVAFIVCQYLGLDTSEFSFQYIASYSLGRERKALELFLDAIQKTALFFIDTLEGAWNAWRLGYQNREFCLLANSKTAMRLFSQDFPVYLFYPGKGELFAMGRKDIEAHEGLFAIERAVWHDSGRLAA